MNRIAARLPAEDLITQYHPGVIWFDGGWIGWNSEDGKDLVSYLHQLDPQLIVNDRANGSGDFGTPGQSIPASGLNRDWETCMTINGNWGFSAHDHGFKSTSLLLHNLIDIASKGGNYPLNVGPTDEGIIPEPEKDRQGWFYVNATDTGWPIQGELNVLMEQDDPQLHGPIGFWQAADAGTLVIRAASHTRGSDARVFWTNLGDIGFSEKNSLGFTLNSDGNYHTYRVKLNDSRAWRGQIVQLRFDPVGSGGKGEWIRIKSMAFEK